MSYHIIHPATHEEWLEERKKGIGASEAGTVMGVSPFKTPQKLWMQKTGRLAPEPESPAMREGHWLEYATAAAFEDMTGATVDPSTLGDWLAVDDDSPWLRVSPDRCYWENGTKPEDRTPENWCVLELKSTNKPVDPENPPLYWILQLQYQMGVLGARKGALCWIDKSAHANEQAFGYKLYDSKENVWQSLKNRLTQFWKVNIGQDICPEPINGEDVLMQNPFAKSGESVPASDDLVQSINRYKQLKTDIKTLEDEVSGIEDAIKLTLGAAEILRGPANAILATWKNRCTNVFDEEKFREENPDLYRIFSAPVLNTSALQEENKALYSKYCSKRPTASRTLRVA